jgi:hypothetical protein
VVLIFTCGVYIASRPLNLMLRLFVPFYYESGLLCCIVLEFGTFVVFLVRSEFGLYQCLQQIEKFHLNLQTLSKFSNEILLALAEFHDRGLCHLFCKS